MCHYRLLAYIRKPLAKSARRFRKTALASRRFVQFRCRTLKSSSRPRQVIAKAEWLVKGDNPRFVVTNLPKHHVGSIHNVYEKLVLRAWRYGEPHQGTAAVSVCRPHQLFADARQSVAAMFIIVRICADAGLAVAGIESYAVHQRTMFDAAGETFENRCTGGCQRPSIVVFVV